MDSTVRQWTVELTGSQTWNNGQPKLLLSIESEVFGLSSVGCRSVSTRGSRSSPSRFRNVWDVPNTQFLVEKRSSDREGKASVVASVRGETRRKVGGYVSCLSTKAKVITINEVSRRKRDGPRVLPIGLPILEVFNMELRNADTLRWHVYEILTNDVPRVSTIIGRDLIGEASCHR
ncbi:hypothetical protein K0M31_003858, partial [Melipona bicolor]